MGIDNIKEEAARVGLELLKSAPDEGNPIVRWGCVCNECGTRIMTHYKAMTDPSRVVSAVESKGWEFRHNRPICPACVAKAKEERKMTTSNKVENVANPRLQRKVFDLLNEHFDENKRLYSVGWSDKKVAEAAQTSEQYVMNLRKGAYAELAEDPAITALRGEIEGLKTYTSALSDTLLNEMSKVEQKITALTTRLDGLSMKKAV